MALIVLEYCVRSGDSVVMLFGVFSLFYGSHCVKDFVLGLRIVVFEAVILLSCCCFHCFISSHCFRVLCCVLGL